MKKTKWLGNDRFWQKKNARAFSQESSLPPSRGIYIYGLYVKEAGAPYSSRTQPCLQTYWIWPLSPFLHVHSFSVFLCISRCLSPAASLLVFWKSFVFRLFPGLHCLWFQRSFGGIHKWISSITAYNCVVMMNTHTFYTHTSVYMNLSLFLSKALARLSKWSLSLRCISCCAAVWCVFIFWLIYLTAAICIWGGEKCVFVCTWVRIIIPFNVYDFLFVFLICKHMYVSSVCFKASKSEIFKH